MFKLKEKILEISKEVKTKYYLVFQKIRLNNCLYKHELQANCNFLESKK